MPVLIILFGLFGAASLIWHFSHSLSILEQWADANGYEILYSEYRNLFRGPFWTSGQGQSVYYVKVRDSSGGTRSGYVRCGSLWFGLFSGDADVRWDVPQ